MPRLSFSLRDVFWLTLGVGMGCAWWMDRQRVKRERDEYWLIGWAMDHRWDGNSDWQEEFNARQKAAP